MKFKRRICKFCNKKLVMWKLINISSFEYFPICTECANWTFEKLKTFDLINPPIKSEILKKARIVIEKKKDLPYGIPE